MKKKRNFISLLIAILILLEVIHPVSTFAAWSKPDYQASSLLYGVVRGPDRFMAVGTNGTLLYSLDGSDGQFTGSIFTGTTVSLNDIVYDGSKYVIVGGNGTILTWGPGNVLGTSNSNTSNILGSVVYGGGKYVATGQFSTVTTSSDGVNWTSQMLTNTGGAYIYSVTYGNKFVAVGQYGKIWTSIDGVAWTEQVSNVGYSLQDVTYSNGQYVAVGGAGTILTSSDGVTWTAQASGTTQGLSGITYGNGRFVAVGSGGTVLNSSNGVNWNVIPSGSTDYLTDIEYGNNTFIIVGDNANLVFENSTVTYDGNAHTGGTVPSDSSTYGIGASATVLGKGSLVRAGYTFAGWNTAANGSGTSYTAGATLTMDMANVTLYAQWTASPTYTVAYNGNGSTGGTVSVDSSAYENGTAVTVSAKGSLVRTGYTFTGWNTAANGSGTSYAAGATLTMGGANVTLYAQWTLTPTYTVTYNGNGSTGGAVPTDGGAYESGATTTVRANTGSLVRTGYTFAGWNTAANGSGTNYAAGATLTMGAANVTLYARWTLNPTYTVTYNGNGSTGGAVPTDGGAYESGATTTVRANTGSLVRTGYTFAGWNTAANGSGTSYAAGATLTMGAANVTLYARWTLTPTYTVTYNGNGTTGGTVPVDSSAYENGTAVTVLGKGTLVRTSYTFAGWNTAANGSGTNYAAGATLTMGAANVTLYAQWTLTPTYTVTYNGNSSTGGTVPVDSSTYENGTAVTVLGKGTLVRTSYTFAGWNTAANGSGTNYAAGATLTMGAANVTLYAQWTLTPTYTVTYNGNSSTGGTVPVDSSAYENGASATVLGKGTLVRAGYTFAGWNTAANGSGTSYAAGATLTMGTANVTLYAQWTLTPTYTVTYSGNSSTGGTVPVDSSAYENGTVVTVLGKGTLVRTSYTFAGWNTAANGSGTSYAAGATLTMGAANETLYAQWILNPTYTVTYNGNGSTGGVVPVDSSAYENGTAVTVLGKGTLVRTSYTFAGWNTAANGSGTSYPAGVTLTMGAANVTLYAQWTLTPTYTVTYNGNGSTGGVVLVDSSAYENGTAVTVLGKGTLVRTGYTFAGWNTAANGSGTNYAAGATLTMGAANVTLYAQWTLTPTYTVTYNGNSSTGGTAPTDGGAYESGQTATVRANIGSLVKAGYTFVGWNTAANGSGTNYATGATLTMGAANVTLYAQWTLTPTYTVTYNGNSSTGGTVPVDSSAYENGTAVTVLGKGTLVRTSYTFTGWNTVANGSGTNYAAGAALTMGAANVTLYAQWTLTPTYTVTYNGNSSTGGTVPVDSSVYENSAAVTVLGKGTLVRTGYTFAGWNTAANGSGTNYAAGATLTMGAANVMLYSQWTLAPTYTVTYNGNSSSGGMVPVDNSAYENGTGATVLGNTGSLVRTSYTFAGWNTSANGSGTSYAAGATLTMGAANVTLYAQWTLTPTYTVTYNENSSTGGTVPVDGSAYENGTAATALGNTGNLVRAGYTFAGWNTAANGSGTSYAAGATLTMGAANVTLYAQWTLTSTYTVTYNENSSTGGTVPVDSSAYENGTAVTVLGKGTLVRTGYTFAGWNTAGNGSGTSYATGATLTMGAANVTLYAQWTLNPTYTITYNGNSSTGGAVPVDSSAYENGTGATVLGNTGNLVRTSYTFAGWNSEANGSGTSYAAGATLTMGTTNVTLYAQWHVSGGSGGSSYIEPVSTDGRLTLPAGARGEVSSEDVVRIYIPSGATDKELKVTIERDIEAGKLLSKEKHPVSGVFNILKNIPDNFKKLVTISFAFERSKLTKGQQPAVFYYDETKKTWTEVAGGKVDGNWISIEVNYFAKFTVLCVGTVNGQRVPCRPANSAPEFSDIIGHWAASNIQLAVSKGIVSGYPNGTFRPNAAVTRAEFVVMLMNTLKLKPQVEKAEISFTDAAKIEAWAKESVAQAVQAGIIGGFEDGSFRPDKGITRSEMVVMIARALNLSVDANTATDFEDDHHIPAWAKGAVKAMKNLGLVNGRSTNEFGPNDKTTRAEAATILLRILEQQSM
ncbi:Listeria/Bacterioides repeat-containing protein [Paenibacillus algorifonticola]|uniref:Listeria/Bacterioides repeat-containing protein n=1 Tax=Paenibacillus algorifonticola TaxID=684063 RepID=A0A1I2CJN7_9BACL|nr:InlB B-repeat-containing protein [Paenibacillus algorifonticola]SFE68557.1 Listeria/Bacterioides repeat-containing protein [Paenibacillus algorifonticola]